VTFSANGFFGPEVSQEFDLRRGVVGEQHRDDVKAVRFSFDAEHSSVDTSSARDLAPLAQIYVHLRRRKPIGRASLYFNEAQCGLLISDEIDLGVYDCTAQVSANR